MANLLISDVCDMRCPYCFAVHHMQARTGAVFIDLDTFERHLDFLDRSGIDEIRLLGGEPTLHPRFPEIIERARQRQKIIVIFSHGLLSERTLAAIEAIPPDECTVLVNTNATRTPGVPSPAEIERRRAVLLRLGGRALLGFNIYSTDFQLDPLLPLIEEAGCIREIRLGLAQATLEGGNAYLHPKQYPVVGQKIAQFAGRAAEYGVKLAFDCGFVRCMFTEHELEMLCAAGTEPHWSCSPILDIDLHGGVMHCFSMGRKVSAELSDEVNAADLRAAFSTQAEPYRAAGIYRHCSVCRFKHNGGCSGGCLAATIRRFRRGSARIKVPKEVTIAVDTHNTILNL
jgi:hypothetical protein